MISGLTWAVSVPAGLAVGGFLIWRTVMLVIEISEAKSTPRFHSVTPIQQAERIEAERLNRISEDENQKRKEDERINEQEKREAKAAEERARFHHVKQTRSATEAAKASLEEF